MGDSTVRPQSAPSSDEATTWNAGPVGTEETTGNEETAGNGDAQPRSQALFPPNRRVVFTNYGRTAFETILQRRNLRGATIVLPAFLCKESFAPILDAYDVEPAFVDVDRRTYHLDFEQASSAAREADAVLLVHTFGVPADVERWRRLADERDVLLIEDCARALGASVAGSPVGSFGDFAIYSLPKVSPATRGGVLAAPPGDGHFDLESPTYDIKHAHPLLPDPLQEAARSGYRWVRKFRDELDESSADDEDGRTTEQEIVEEGWSPTPRNLDPINRLVFERYLRREFDARLRHNAAAARRVRETGEKLGVEFQRQRVRATSPFHVVGMTVPSPDETGSSRDELVSRLREADVPVETCWDSPLVTVYDEGGLSAYPNTKKLAERAFQLPLFEMDGDEVTKAVGVIAEVMTNGLGSKSR